MVLLYCSGRSAVWVWYAVVVRCCTTKNVRIVSKTFLQTADHFQKEESRARVWIDPLVETIHTTRGAVIFNDQITRANIIYQLMMTTRNQFPVSFFENWLNISQSTNSMGPLAVNSFLWHFFSRLAQFLHHSRQWALSHKHCWPCVARRACISWYWLS